MNMAFAAEVAAGPLFHLLTDPSSEERAAYLIEFIAEIQPYANRVPQCAINNGVRISYMVELRFHRHVATHAVGTAGANTNAVWNRWESSIGA